MKSYSNYQSRVFTGSKGYFVEDGSPSPTNHVFMASIEWYHSHRDENGNFLVTYPQVFGTMPKIDMSRAFKTPSFQAAAHQPATITEYTIPALIASPQSVHNQGMSHALSKPPRPANAFILFRKNFHPVAKAENPGLKNVELCKFLPFHVSSSNHP